MAPKCLTAQISNHMATTRHRAHRAPISASGPSVPSSCREAGDESCSRYQRWRGQLAPQKVRPRTQTHEFRVSCVTYRIDSDSFHSAPVSHLLVVATPLAGTNDRLPQAKVFDILAGTGAPPARTRDVTRIDPDSGCDLKDPSRNELTCSTKGLHRHPTKFSQPFYRGDTYDPVAELRAST